MIPILVLLNIILITSTYSASDFNVTEDFQNPKFIKKCCPADQIAIYKRKKCMLYNNGTIVQFSLPVYDADIRDTGKNMTEVFVLETHAFANKSFRKRVYESLGMGFRPYLTESGNLYLELPNAFKRWTVMTADSYCFDYVVELNSTSKPKLAVFARFEDDEIMLQSNAFFTTGMIISCVFLTLVLVVYLVLPELRNLGGLVLMAYVFSLLLAFIFLMTVQRGHHSLAGCLSLTLLVYFFLLASFFWMNIMSLDIWWTFRGYAKARPIHRRGERFKFFMYCLYAWGVPFLMATILLVFNNTNLTHIPWFITPKIPAKGCFLEGGEKLLYLYIPMLILIFLNWVFFLMTAFNIWRLSRGTAVLDSAAAGSPAAHRTQRHRLLLYLKLSILMGLNWVLEVASFFKAELKIWYISDAYNLLIGLAIFLIFVCKKKILKKLLKRYRNIRDSNWKFFPNPPSRQSSRSSSSTDYSNATQETQMQVCINPKGATAYNPLLIHDYKPNAEF